MNSRILPFLDVKISIINGQYTYSTYQKPTDTGFYTTSNSACDEKYRKNLPNGLIYRVWQIGSIYQIMKKRHEKAHSNTSRQWLCET